MNTVVTGANGFIGNVLVRELLQRGHRVRAVVSKNAQNLEGLSIEIFGADVRKASSLRAAFDGAESVFHLAAVISLIGDRGGRVTETNINGAENAARAALDAGVKRFVHCSSIHAFDLSDTGAMIDETTRQAGKRHPVYDRSKAAGEAAVRRAIRDGLPGVIVNPSAVIGPFDREPSRMGKVFLALAARKLPALIQSGFDWVDVRDVCHGALAALEHGRIGENYLLTGCWHSVRELATFAEEVTGIAPPPFDVPLWLARLAAPLGDLWSAVSGSETQFNSYALQALRGSRIISHAKAEKELHFSPRSTRDSVHDTYRWFAETAQLPPLSDGIDPRPHG